jgi:hypothetical protein
MRFVTSLLFVLTVIAGFLAYKGVGTLTETVKLTYAYLEWSTVACTLISLTMRPSVQHRTPIADKYPQ